MYKYINIRENKKQFLPNSGYVNSTIGMHHMNNIKMYWEKSKRELHKNATSYMEHILKETSHERAALQPLTSYF